MTGGSVDRGDDRRPSILDIDPSLYPLTAVPSSVPTICAASTTRLPWMRNGGATNAPPDSPPTSEFDVLSSTPPRRRFSRHSTSHYRGSVITIVPSLKLTSQARGSSASEEQEDLKPHQSHKSTESNSPEGRVIHPKPNVEEDIIEEHSATGELSSHWWTPPSPATTQEGEGETMRTPSIKVGVSAPSQWRIRDSRVGSKRWSLPH